MDLSNNYIYKAIDYFPYALEETMEALNYALSYDQKNIVALGLMGRVYAEYLKEYEKAKACYTEALAANINAIEIYPYYADVLIWNEDYKEAESLIDFALTVKGTDKGRLYLKKALILERRKSYKTALETLKIAKQFTFSSEFMDQLKEEKERIKGKISKKSYKKKEKTKSKKKKK